MQNLHVDCYHRENHAKPINGAGTLKGNMSSSCVAVFTPTQRHPPSIENSTIPDHLPNNKQSIPQQ